MLNTAAEEKSAARIAILLLCGILYTALLLPTAELVYRLYLFCTTYHFQRYVNHVGSVSKTWTILGLVLFAATVLWLFARVHKHSRYVVPIIIAATSLLMLFYGMRASGILITYDEYIFDQRSGEAYSSVNR